MLAVEDAEKLTIPHMVLASNGEDVEVVKQYKAVIEGEGKTGVVSIPTYLFVLSIFLSPCSLSCGTNILGQGGNLSYYAPWVDGRQSQPVEPRQSEGV